MRKIADMHNRLIAAFGGQPPAEHAGPEADPAERDSVQTAPAAPIAFPRPLAANIAVASPAWLNFFTRLSHHRHSDAGRSEPGLAPTASGDDSASLLDALGEIAVVRSQDGVIHTANRTFCEIAGYAVPQGLDLQQVGFRLRSEKGSLLAASPPAGQDLEIDTPAGLRIFLWRDVRRVGRDGAVLLHGFAREVTQERLANEEQESARRKAEAVNATKSRQLATVVHEIRTPLNGILGMGQLLGHTGLTPEQQNYVGGIRQAGQALALLVDDLLDQSTMEAGRFKLNTRAENLRQVIESVVEMLAPRAHEKQVEIGAVVLSDLPELFDFDPARLRQVLFNVIGNAVKFTREGGVLVRAWPDAGDVVISVADSGPGMTAEEQARIFGEFEQAGSAESRSGGTGLGMAISRRIVQEFGGVLSVESELGKGSTFLIRLPLKPAEIGDIAAHDGRHPASGAAVDRACALSRSRVLLLAPQGPSAQAIMAMIETLGGSCILADTDDAVTAQIEQAWGNGARITDVIVDHRLAGNAFNGLHGCGLRRILLVNPEERSSQPQELYDAWLIRPLRERTLIDVLRGRLGSRDTAQPSADGTPSHEDPAGDAGSSSGVAAEIAPAPMADPPVPPQPHAGHVAPARLEPSGQPSTPPRDALSILLAEDDAVSAMLYATILQRSGHKVLRVADFPALISTACSENPPDLVISDMHMPGGEIGEALLSIARASGQRDGRPMPVIVLTGEGRRELHARVLSQGAAHVVEKPVLPQALADLVRQFGKSAMRQAS